jgi:hypothetical protein
VEPAANLGTGVPTLKLASGNRAVKRKVDMKELMGYPKGEHVGRPTISGSANSRVGPVAGDDRRAGEGGADDGGTHRIGSGSLTSCSY